MSFAAALDGNNADRMGRAGPSVDGTGTVAHD